MSSTLTDEEYKRAIELCFSVCEAAHCPEGGPTVVGSFLGRLRQLLSRPGPHRAQVEQYLTHTEDCDRYGVDTLAAHPQRPDSCSCVVSQVLDDLESLGVVGWAREESSTDSTT